MSNRLESRSGFWRLSACCSIVLLFLNACATTQNQGNLSYEGILIDSYHESQTRLSCYEQEQTELNQQLKEGKVSQKDYKQKTEILDKLTIKELHLELKISENAPHSEILESAKDLNSTLQVAKSIGMACGVFVIALCALPVILLTPQKLN